MIPYATKLTIFYFAGMLMAWMALAKYLPEKDDEPDTRLMVCGIMAFFWPVLLLFSILLLLVVCVAVWWPNDVGDD